MNKHATCVETSQFKELKVDHLNIEEQKDIIRLASEIIISSFSRGKQITNTDELRKKMQILLANRVDEVFCMLYLDSDNCILSFEEHFH